MKKVKVVRIIIEVLLLIVLILIVIFRSFGIAGYTVRRIVSSSMEPTLQVNSIVLIKKCGIEDIELQDIICFFDNTVQTDVVHRVIGFEEKDEIVTLITKGDNNKAEDSNRVTADSIVGKVIERCSG